MISEKYMLVLVFIPVNFFFQLFLIGTTYPALTEMQIQLILLNGIQDMAGQVFHNIFTLATDACRSCTQGYVLVAVTSNTTFTRRASLALRCVAAVVTVKIQSIFSFSVTCIVTTYWYYTTQLCRTAVSVLM